MNTPHVARRMRYFTVLLLLAAAAFALLASSCSGSKVIPPELKEQIDSSVSFRDIQASPQALQGRVVLLGGEVLGARLVQDGVELEVLQLPVKDDDPPVERRTESQGRFLAIDRAAGDPASFPPGQRSLSSGRSPARKHAALTNPPTGILSSRSSTCTSGVTTVIASAHAALLAYSEEWALDSGVAEGVAVSVVSVSALGSSRSARPRMVRTRTTPSSVLCGHQSDRRWKKCQVYRVRRLW